MKKCFKNIVFLSLILGLSASAGRTEDEKDLSLIEAVEAGQFDKVKQLLAAGADISVTDRYKEGVLIYAVRAENLEMTRFFLEKGVDVEARNAFKMTPLLVAANIGHYDICKLLLEHGADVNAADFEGITPFMNAAVGDSIPLIDLFVEYGAALNAVDRNGRSALDYVRFADYQETIKHLEKLGVTANQTTSYDRLQAGTPTQPNKITKAAPVPRLSYHYLALPKDVDPQALEAHEDAMKRITSGDFRSAGSLFRSAFDLAPDCVEALRNLATYAAQLKKSEIVEDLEPQILSRYDLNKGIAAEVALRLGIAVGGPRPLTDERFRKAQIWLRQALGLTDAKDVPTLFHLGELYEAGAVYDQAELYYKEVVKNATDSEWATFAGERLTVVENLKKGILVLPAEDENGNLLSMADYQGKVVLVDLWASWCKPCIAAGPFLRGWDRMSKKKPVVIIGVNTDRDRDAYLKALKKEDITWKQYLDPSHQVGPMFGSNSLPTFLVFDHEGKLVYKASGWSDRRSQELNNVLNRLVHQAKKAKKKAAKQKKTAL